MEVIILDSVEKASDKGAAIVEGLIKRKKDCVLGLATGRTPNELYKRLIEKHRSGGLDFSNVSSFNLDEYVGLEPSDPASYRHTINSVFLSHVNIDLSRTHVPNGMAKVIPAHCLEYENAIVEAGGIDLQILGLGGNGHIGFNEPTSSLGSRTRIKTLTQKTLEANKSQFSTPPKHCITMGIATIMEARHCLLLAFGESKAQAVADFVEGPITSMVPASALQMHPHVTVLLDEAAASKLKRADYYKEVLDSKPEWQRF